MSNQFEIKRRMINDFFIPKGQWVDEIVRQQYPRWLSWIAERGIKSRLLQIILAKFSGLEIKDNQDTAILGMSKGFRPGVSGYIIKGVRTTIFKRGQKVGERYFKLDLHIDGELDPALFIKK